MSLDIPDTLTFRRTLWHAIEPSAHKGAGLSTINQMLVAAILLGVTVSILATEPRLGIMVLSALQIVELVLTIIFVVEYATRLWVAAESEGTSSNFAKRLRFMASPSALLDLVAIVVSILPFIGANAMGLRLIRLLKIVSLAKLGRMSAAISHLSDAIAARRFELLATFGLACGLMVFGATALYWVEGELQPDKFGSIPRSLWWAVITLTTIGYGDVFPITPLGKIIAGFVALVGIGVIALPTSILAAALSDAVVRSRGVGQDKGDDQS